MIAIIVAKHALFGQRRTRVKQINIVITCCGRRWHKHRSAMVAAKNRFTENRTFISGDGSNVDQGPLFKSRRRWWIAA